jgi:ribosome maturation factor RimP
VNRLLVADSRDIIESVRETAAIIVRALDLELVDVECVGQGPGSIVRVFVDKPGGVNVNDCERVHVSLGHALDVKDPIPHAYVLEVSSPGLDRPLKRREDYHRSVGKLLNLKLRRPFEGQWRLIGRLVEDHDAGITLSLIRADQTRTVLFRWEDIAGGRLEVEFSR